MKVYDKGALGIGALWGALGLIRLWVNGIEDWFFILMCGVLSVTWIYRGLSQTAAEKNRSHGEKARLAYQEMFGEHVNFWTFWIYWVFLCMTLLMCFLPHPYESWMVLPLLLCLGYAIWLSYAVNRKIDEMECSDTTTTQKPAEEGVDASYCFLVEKEQIWAEMLMKALTDQGIPCTALPVYGAGVTMRSGTKERMKIYVQADKKAQADALMAELFSEEK